MLDNDIHIVIYICVLEIEYCYGLIFGVEVVENDRNTYI